MQNWKTRRSNAENTVHLKNTEVAYLVHNTFYASSATPFSSLQLLGFSLLSTASLYKIVALLSSRSNSCSDFVELWRVSDLEFQFRTTQGQFLICDGEGCSVSAVTESPSTKETFYIERNYNNRVHIRLNSRTYLQACLCLSLWWSILQLASICVNCGEAIDDDTNQLFGFSSVSCFIGPDLPFQLFMIW